MLAIYLAVGLVVALAVAWLFTRTGSEAFDLCARHPKIFLPAIALLLATFLIGEMPRAASAPWTTWRLPGITLSPNFTLFLELAAHVLAAAWLFSLVGRALGFPAVPFSRVCGLTLGALAAFWVGMFACMIPMTLFVQGGRELLIGALLAWAVGLWWVNARLAPLPAAIHAGGGTLAAMNGLYRAESARYRAAAAIHLLALGMIIFIYYSTSGPQVGIVPFFGKTQETWKFNVDAQCVLNVTVSNTWAKVISNVTGREMPAALAWAVRALTAALSTIFVAGYASLGARALRSASPPAA